MIRRPWPGYSGSANVPGVGLPTLDRVKNERVGELAKKLGRSSTEILGFGQAAQTVISGSADGMLQHVRMRSTGYAGELLPARGADAEPRPLDATRGEGASEKPAPRRPPLRVARPADQNLPPAFRRGGGGAERDQSSSGGTRIAAFQGIQQMETLRNDADRYNNASRSASPRCDQAGGVPRGVPPEAEPTAGVGRPRRTGQPPRPLGPDGASPPACVFLQMALSLAENTTHESRQVEKVLTFSANALQEAATLGLTAWKQKLTVAINLLARGTN